MDVARRDGKGFVQFQWPRVKDGPPIDKMAYVTDFKPWSWVISTGVYIDDIEKTFRAKVIEVGIAALATLLLAAALSVLIARSITRPLSVLITRMRGLAAGETEQTVRGTERGDEI